MACFFWHPALIRIFVHGVIFQHFHMVMFIVCFTARVALTQVIPSGQTKAHIVHLIALHLKSVSQSPSSSQSPSLSPSSSQSSSSSTLSPGLPEPLPMVRQLYNNESQIENIVSKALLSEQAIATYATTGVSRSLATAVKPPKPICYYPGNNKCPQVPQKATAASCSCRK